MLIGRTRSGELRWTDDTQMALDLAESLLEHGRLDPDALAARFAGSYHWSRGYGPGTARMLKQTRKGQEWVTARRCVHPHGSFGNGAAMRAPVLALFFGSDSDLVGVSMDAARVTHAHPLGVEGAVVVTVAARALMQGCGARETLEAVQAVSSSPDIRARLETLQRWHARGFQPGPREVAQTLGNGMTAPTSCPTALYIALRHLDVPFGDMMDFVIECGGDTDTIGAMAGALWGICNGPDGLPDIALEERSRILGVAERLRGRYRAWSAPS